MHPTRVALLCVVTLLVASVSHAQTAQNDQQFLRDFIASTNVTLQYGQWQSANVASACGPSSSWSGLTCEDNGAGEYHITQLRFYIPNFPIQGTVPASLSTLVNLTALVLSEQKMTGNFPDISNLTKLVDLYIYSNLFSGPLPSPQAPELYNYYVDQNRFTGTISESFGERLKLNEFFVSNNLLTGPVPSFITTHPRLTKATMNRNLLSGPLPTSWNSTVLETFEATGNRINGTIPSQFFDPALLPRLFRLDLSDNELSGEIPPILRCPDFLSLRYNKLTGKIPAITSYNGNDLKIYLSNNKLTGGVPASIYQQMFLAELKLDRNQLTSYPPELFSLPYLKVLGLSNNPYPPGPLPIPDTPAPLQSLKMEYSGITGQIPSWLGDLTNLQILILDGNQLTGSIPDTLMTGSTLRFMSLAHNKLNGTIPDPTLSGAWQFIVLSDNDLQCPTTATWETFSTSNIVGCDLAGNNACEFAPDQVYSSSIGCSVNVQSCRLTPCKNNLPTSKITSSAVYSSLGPSFRLFLDGAYPKAGLEVVDSAGNVRFGYYASVESVFESYGSVAERSYDVTNLFKRNRYLYKETTWTLTEGSFQGQNGTVRTWTYQGTLANGAIAKVHVYAFGKPDTINILSYDAHLRENSIKFSFEVENWPDVVNLPTQCQRWVIFQEEATCLPGLSLEFNISSTEDFVGTLVTGGSGDLTGDVTAEFTFSPSQFVGIFNFLPLGQIDGQTSYDTAFLRSGFDSVDTATSIPFVPRRSLVVYLHAFALGTITRFTVDPDLALLFTIEPEPSAPPTDANTSALGIGLGIGITAVVVVAVAVVFLVKPIRSRVMPFFGAKRDDTVSRTLQQQTRERLQAEARNTAEAQNHGNWRASTKPHTSELRNTVES